jgi:hypothetical protein
LATNASENFLAATDRNRHIRGDHQNNCPALGRNLLHVRAPIQSWDWFSTSEESRILVYLASKPELACKASAVRYRSVTIRSYFPGLKKSVNVSLSLGILSWFRALFGYRLGRPARRLL